MPKYRKIPVVIEAVQVNNRDPAPGWLNMAFNSGAAQPNPHDHGAGSVLIKTLEGEMRADPGDWIIQGVNGEIYPCKPDIFAKTYEPAEPPTMSTEGLDAKEEWRHPEQRYERFEIAIREQINSVSMENGSNTPDFILAEFLKNCLLAFDIAGQRREKWYGYRMKQLEHELKAARDSLGQKDAQINALCAQLDAEGQHTAAANANIDRLNTEIERVTRRQQGELAGKG